MSGYTFCKAFTPNSMLCASLSLFHREGMLGSSSLWLNSKFFLQTASHFINFHSFCCLLGNIRFFNNYLIIIINNATTSWILCRIICTCSNACKLDYKVRKLGVQSLYIHHFPNLVNYLTTYFNTLS